MHSIVTASTTIATASTTSLCLYYYKYLLRLYDPYYYNIYHATTISTATAPNMSQCIMIYYRPHGLISMLSKEQPLLPDHGSRPTLPKLPREPTGCASLGAAGGTQRPSPRPRLCHVLLSYCVLCFAIFVIRYPRTKTYKPRGRASDVSTISTCFSFVMIYCLLPTNLCEKGWGYHCRVLVWLLALLLN